MKQNGEAGILHCISEDHQNLKLILDRLEDSDILLPEKKILVKELLLALDFHVQAEEDALLSRALREDSLHSMTLRCLEEHELLDLALDRLKRAGSEKQWMARLELLSFLLRSHMERERHEFFPAVSVSIDVKELEELGLRYLDAKRRCEFTPVLHFPVRDQLLEGAAAS